MTACKDCRYNQGNECRGVRIKVIHQSRFNPIEGQIEHPVEYKFALCQNINRGECKLFESKPTMRRDGWRESFAFSIFGAGIYQHKQELEERRNGRADL